jgi:transposase-like protein
MQLQVPKKKRRHFTAQEKVCFICNVRKRLENGLSQRATCKELNIHHTLCGLWKKQMEEMRQSRNSKAKSLCQGCQSSLAPIKEVLLRFIFELREQGMGVSIAMVMLKAAHQEKSRIAQYNVAQQFVRHHGMVHWIGTKVLN